jgi:hypothetical protein
MVLRLEAHCYNKSHLSPKLMASLRLVIKSISLFVSNLCLTFLSSACCISFTSKSSVLLGSHLSSSRIVVISHVIYITILISYVTSRTIMFYLSKWTLFLITPSNCLCWRALHWEKTITARHWNVKVLFFLGHSTKTLDQEYWGMKNHTSGVVRNRHIPQGEIDISLKREVAWDTMKNFPLFIWLDITFSFATSRHSSSFTCAPPPFVNLRTRFL